MKTLECKCGHQLTLNYRDAEYISLPTLKGDDIIFFYQWTCEFCGRIYQERQPDPIYIDQPTFNKLDKDTKVKDSELSDKPLSINANSTPKESV